VGKGIFEQELIQVGIAAVKPDRGRGSQPFNRAVL
jgi:hypothetical protein